MIEGQEGVTWPEWVALARACEEHGVPALFRSDHHLNLDGVDERGSLDAWATINALAACTTTLRLGTLVSPGHVPPPVRAGEARRRPPTTCPAGGSSSGSARAGTSASTRPTASRSRRWASGWTCSPSSSRSCTGSGPSRRSRSPARTTRSTRSTRSRKPVQSPHPPLIMGGERRAARRRRSPRAGRTSTTPRSPPLDELPPSEGARATRRARRPGASRSRSR